MLCDATGSGDKDQHWEEKVDMDVDALGDGKRRGGGKDAESGRYSKREKTNKQTIDKQWPVRTDEM